MNRWVLDFQEIEQAELAVVGGKGAHLAALSGLEGIRVPDGFCVTTEAYRRLVAEAPGIEVLIARLGRLKADEREAIGAQSAALREAIELVAIPSDLAAAILRALARLGENPPCAVRSSATAEDLPTASFAGQQDSYLNVVGPTAILEHVRRCWASLFTERAVTYRLRNGFDQRKVHMAVVVQRMVFPQVAGVLFTADPLTGNRKVASVEAIFGLGEALVSGRVNADVYKVRAGEVSATVAGSERALTDAQVVQLVQLGRRIEAHFDRPQDIEWCLVDDDFHVVQSRPITTLFPIPAVSDGQNHVYLSVGHQQMMTDAMKPLGLSLFKLTTRAPMHEAGGRLFVDITRNLGSTAGRAGLLSLAGKSDPLIHDALENIIERDFVPLLPDAPAGAPAAGSAAAAGSAIPIETDPAIVTGLIERSQASLAELRQEIRSKSGPELLDFIVADLAELQRLLFDPLSHQVFMSAIEATWWLNDNLQTWLGEKNAADTLTQSVPNNVTSEMGLELLDVADAIRPHPEVIAFLQRVDNEHFLDELGRVEGGRKAQEALRAYLQKYGMRCVGEIDITRPRFAERPSMLLPLLLGNIKNFEPGARAQRFARGLEEARTKEQRLLQRLLSLPDGAQKAEETKRKIDRVRTFIGYREYPKYAMISRYFMYKQALLAEAERLTRARVLREPEDIFYLTFAELGEVLRTQRLNEQLIHQRKAAFSSYRALTPPRVLTSEGEVISGAYRRRDVPPGALVGLAVSAGTVEGRARVVSNLAEADLEAGDILVTAYTDPSFSPLFVVAKGLVTEVGGLMTHGAVIAREYGLAAVVGVEHATRLIRDGQRVRVNGTDGYVELL